MRRLSPASVIGVAIAALLLPAHQATAQKLLPEGIKDLASQITVKVTRQQKHKIAVLPFKELEGQPTILGSYLSESLVTALFDTPGLDIVERSMLDKVVGELRLDQSGLIDPSMAKRVGKIVGVDAIVTGTITDLASFVAVNCRLIDAQTGRIFAAAETRIAKDDDVRKIMAAPAARLSGQPIEEPSAGGGRPQKRGATSRSSQQRDASGFHFDLKSCTLGGATLTCNFLITNQGEDRELQIVSSPQYRTGVGGSTRLIDDSGDQYQSTEATLANTRGTWVISRLASGIPVRAQLQFEGVKPELKEAKLIELACISVRGPFVVQFRDVPIVRP
ncbi:MAG TPA: FlgO family outer membrane protein [Thermoanaerobaculia bacterium]|nr:FlgO family outer membrane protein [Thermoanaerobaculia bacterium]